MAHPLLLRIIVRACTVADNVRVVHWAWQRDGASAACIHVAQRKAELLKRIRRKLVLVEQYRVMARAGGTKQASMRLQVEVELGGMYDVRVDDCAGRTVAAPVSIVRVLWEHADMMALSNNDDREKGCGLDV